MSDMRAHICSKSVKKKHAQLQDQTSGLQHNILLTSDPVYISHVKICQHFSLEIVNHSNIRFPSQRWKYYSSPTAVGLPDKQFQQQSRIH